MRKTILTQFNWCLLLMAAVGVCASAIHADPEKGDVYFGTLRNVDLGSNTIHMDVINLNIRTKAKGTKSFRFLPGADVAIEQSDRKFHPGVSLSDISTQRWVWVDTYDGETTTRRVTATSFESFRGIVKELKPDEAVVQLSRTSIGRRIWNQSAKKPPKNFRIPPTVPCDYQGQPVSLSLIEPGMEIDVLTERGVVVKVTIR